MRHDADLYTRLAHQGLGRSLSADERAFAEKLEKLFASGVHDFQHVAVGLNESGCARPSGNSEPWSADILLAELKTLNQNLDEAYATRGSEPRVYG